MNVTSCGELQGNYVFYFHGAPGAPDESLLFDQYAKDARLHIVCLDRFAIDKNIHGHDYYQQLADKITAIAGNEPVDIIGFSIGAQVAIEVSTLLSDQVAHLHLVSAAAPLQQLKANTEIAGASIFAVAAKFPLLFSLLCYWQSLLSMIAPGLLFKMLFASAEGDDLGMREQADFKAFISSLLVRCFSKRVPGYIRDIRHYVEPWGEALPRCQAATTLWHGRSDNWSPLAMAQLLETSMPNVQALKPFDELSHYSCLYHCAPLICKILAKNSDN